MNKFFDICCGSGEERFKDSGFVETNGSEWHTLLDNGTDELHTRRKTPPAREKAALALELKRKGRESIFSCPLDVNCSWTPPVYEKSPEDEEFLRAAMGEHILFQDLSNAEWKLLIDATERVVLEKGEKAVQQHTQGQHLFFVQEGDLDMICEVGQVCHASLSAGDVFGELALLSGKEYELSVISKDGAVLWRLGQDVFRNVVARQKRNEDADIIKFIRKVELFHDLSEAHIQKFAECVTTVKFSEGEIIVRKGETGEAFYMIESGSVKVYDVGMGDSVSSEHMLEAGDSFGEGALLMDEPRSASIMAMTEVTTLVMDRLTFETYIGELRDLIDLSSRRNVLKTLPIFAGGDDITEAEYERLAECMKDVCIKEGTKLVSLGKPYPRNVWFVRKGQIIVYGNKSGKIFCISNGDYFGEKSILADPDHISSHEAVCEDNVNAWVLSKEDIESVIVNLDRLGSAGAFRKSKQISNEIGGLVDIKKHRILGQGGFGKVWLVESVFTGGPFALKVMSKRRLLDAKQERSVLREKELLSLLNHPFILDMVAAFQDALNLYLVLPLIQGGELFSVVSSKTKYGHGLLNDDAAFYAAGVISALGHFHHRLIAYRDLKLENVMIDSHGYPKIVDLGFARIVVDKSYTFCGTPEYCAPEMILAKGHNHAVDYWALGVLIYELIVGHSPFRKPGQTQMDLFKSILLLQYKLPVLISSTGQDLISRLLVRDVKKRFGTRSRGHRDIFDHSWFKESDIDFRKLVNKEIAAPWVPDVKDPFDASHFDDFSKLEKEWTLSTKYLSAEEQAVFKDF